MQLGRSALACLQSASCGPHELWAMLRGLPVRGVTLPDHRLAFAHKRVLDDIEAAGYGDVIDDELEGWPRLRASMRANCVISVRSLQRSSVSWTTRG